MTSASSTRSPSAVRTFGFVVAVFLAIWGMKLIAIDRYGTDVPYWDQWAKEGEFMFVPWFERGEFWKSLFIPHNEHRIAPTLAFNLGLLRLAGDQWDARVQCVASAALHALVAAGIAWWALRRLTRPWALAVGVLLVVITGPPIAWENVLGGFQSQFYFLAGFSLLALGGMLGSGAFSWRWWGGLVAAGLACISMGSGMLVAAPLAVIAVLRIARGEQRRAAVATLVAALLIGAIGGWFRPQAPWHATMHAHSLFECAAYAARCLAWPLYGAPWFAAVIWAPWLVLAFRRLVSRSGEPKANTLATDFVLGGGLWVLTQVAAVSYSRGGGSVLPAARYGDICALGIVFGFSALALLGAKSRRHFIRYSAGSWFLALVVAVVMATHAMMLDALPNKKRENVAYERHVQAFVLTDDYATFEKAEPLPFPSAEWLARTLRNPTLRRLLPASIRPPISVPEIAYASAPAPVLDHRKTRTVVSGAEWHSAPLPRGRGWWKIETSGDLGRAGATLELVSSADGRVLGSIIPTRVPGESWRAAYVPAPHEPASLVARVTAPARWLAFSEPVEMSSLSYHIWRLTQNGAWFILIAVCGLVGYGVSLTRR